MVARRRPGEGHGHARRRSSCSNCGGGDFGGLPDDLHWADRFGGEHGEAQESFAALVLVRRSSRRLIDYINRDGLPVAFATLSELSAIVSRARAPLRFLWIRFYDSGILRASATSRVPAAPILGNEILRLEAALVRRARELRKQVRSNKKVRQAFQPVGLGKAISNESYARGLTVT